jgi:zinc protease
MQKNHPFRLLALSAAIAAAAAAFAQAAGLPAQVREVEGVHEYRLPNGLQVLLIPDESKPTVTVNVTYRVGSRMEGYGETGMAHLLEHLMFKSTKNIPQVSTELSKRGMQFNGSTTADRTNYFETFPSDPAQLSWALKTEAERMVHANVIKKDLDSEMTVVRNEMESGENNPFRILMEKTNAAAFQWHAYGKDTIGARSDVENVNIPHLQAFYRKYYQPDNATLIVAGKFDAAKVLAEIAQDFAAIPKPTRVIEPTYTVEPVQDGEREVTLRRVGSEQDLYVTYHTPSIASPDMPAFSVIANALGDTPNGRLHKRLVETGKATQAFAWPSRHTDPGHLQRRRGAEEGRRPRRRAEDLPRHDRRPEGRADHGRRTQARAAADRQGLRPAAREPAGPVRDAVRVHRRRRLAPAVPAARSRRRADAGAGQRGRRPGSSRRTARWAASSRPTRPTARRSPRAPIPRPS